jgi:hypothetical protein
MLFYYFLLSFFREFVVFIAIINNCKQINKSESYDYVVDLPIGNFPFNVRAFITIIHYKMSKDTIVDWESTIHKNKDPRTVNMLEMWMP